MNKAQFVIAGTDTGVGKTIFAAALTQALAAVYFKPIQAGLAAETDTDTVKRLSGLPNAHFLPEIYRLRTPASPHIAARIDNTEIDTEALTVPKVDGPLVVEGVGGLLVPLTNRTLLIDILARWKLPVILCARTALGTINHSLLSLEALNRRSIPVLGIAFIGDENAEVESTIVDFGNIKYLGRLPWLSNLDSDSLAEAFRDNFELPHIMKGMERL